MKIILIRQAETDMQWEKRCDAASFERAVETDLASRAAPCAVRQNDAASYRIYTGTCPAAMDTAAMLFACSEPPISTSLLDDVPLRAFEDTGASRPLWMWRIMGQAQWFFGSARQPESRQDTTSRVMRFVDRLETEDRDCVVICRGLVMATLKSVLRSCGYLLEGGDLLPKPLDRVRATKKSLHCGGCHHNCLLSDPKCQIGQNKARGLR